MRFPGNLGFFELAALVFYGPPIQSTQSIRLVVLISRNRLISSFQAGSVSAIFLGEPQVILRLRRCQLRSRRLEPTAIPGPAAG